MKRVQLQRLQTVDFHNAFIKRTLRQRSFPTGYQILEKLGINDRVLVELGNLGKHNLHFEDSGQTAPVGKAVAPK